MESLTLFFVIRINMVSPTFLLFSFFFFSTTIQSLSEASYIGTPINPWMKFACTPENIKVMPDLGKTRSVVAPQNYLTHSDV